MAARWWLVLALAWAPFALAQDGTAPPADGAELATIVVTGEQPGPGLWQVRKGGHVLWVLGTLAPLPRAMQWRAGEVGERIAQAQALLDRPGLSIKSDLGWFGQLALAPWLIGVRNLPDGKKLEDVVPAELYARWQVLKRRYLGRGNKVERWRPLFAATALYRAAVRANGMSVETAAVDERIAQFAKEAKLTPIPLRIEIALDRPRAAIKQFKHEQIDDIACFARTIERLETDLVTMRQRANAWASGDLAALRALPYVDQSAACFEAMQRSQVLQAAGDIEARARELWLDAAGKALDAHAVSLALLPMSEVVGADGYLGALRARGYEVIAPDADEGNDAGASSDGPASAASASP